MAEFTFYQLTNTPGSDETFSPHVWKTKADLAILGVKPAQSVKLSFPQIRGELSEESGNNTITVPAIKLSSGEYIPDSWAIAEYLDKEYGKEGKRLFPEEASKSLIKFLEEWVNFQFGAELRPLIGPKIYAKLDQPSRDYWLVARFSNDPAKLQAFLDKLEDPETNKTQPTAAREKLQLIENLLKYNTTKSGENNGWLLGAEPSHADALLFGWYAFSRVNPIWEKELWGHETLPLVKQWVEKIKGVVGSDELPY